MSTSDQRTQQEFKMFLKMVSQHLVSSNLMKEASAGGKITTQAWGKFLACLEEINAGNK